MPVNTLHTSVSQTLQNSQPRSSDQEQHSVDDLYAALQTSEQQNEGYQAVPDSVAVVQRDTTLNVYTGNPGIYHGPDDTLFYWDRGNFETLFPQTVVSVEPQGPKGFEGKPVNPPKPDWVIGAIILCWAIFASLRTGFAKYLAQVFHSIVSLAASSRLYREKGYNNNFGAIRMGLIFGVVMPLSLYQVAQFNGMSLMGFSDFILFLAILAVSNSYFILKYGLYKLSGSILQIKDDVKELVFNMKMHNRVLGILLLVIATTQALTHQFHDILQWVPLGTIALFYLLSLLRTIYFSVRKGVSIFYLILYLCTLEILPILFVVKLSVDG